jgi:hypothetical protein
MMIVTDKIMGMNQMRMLVGVTLGFRPFTPFMPVLMMLVVMVVMAVVELFSEGPAV